MTLRLLLNQNTQLHQVLCVCILCVCVCVRERERVRENVLNIENVQSFTIALMQKYSEHTIL